MSIPFLERRGTNTSSRSGVRNRVPLPAERPNAMLAASDSHGYSKFAPLIVLLEMALASAGCAGLGASGGNASRSASLDAVTGEELRQVSARDTYEALEQLRPIWLLPRPRSSLVYAEASRPVVYVSGILYGAVNTLREIEVNDARRIDYMNPLDATTRYGIGHGGRSNLGRAQAVRGAARGCLRVHCGPRRGQLSARGWRCTFPGSHAAALTR